MNFRLTPLVIVPPMGNEFNVMLKNTTLVSVIGVQELMLSTQMITSVNFRVFELCLVLALYFPTSICISAT